MSQVGFQHLYTASMFRGTQAEGYPQPRSMRTKSNVYSLNRYGEVSGYTFLRLINSNGNKSKLRVFR